MSESDSLFENRTYNLFPALSHIYLTIRSQICNFIFPFFPVFLCWFIAFPSTPSKVTFLGNLNVNMDRMTNYLPMILHDGPFNACLKSDIPFPSQHEHFPLHSDSYYCSETNHFCTVNFTIYNPHLVLSVV